MQDQVVYRILVKGQLDGDDFNRTSPIQITIEGASDAESVFTFLADQSGLIGLIRFLHRQGILICSVCRQRQADPPCTEKEQIDDI